jgi:hypothetical protein
MRRNKHFPKPAVPATQKIETRPPPAISAPGTRATGVQTKVTPVSVPPDSPTPKGKKPVSKAAASQQAPAGKPVQEAKTSHPMETRETGGGSGTFSPLISIRTTLVGPDFH